MNIIKREKPDGVIVQFGGQTSINLAVPLANAGVKILGTPYDSIDIAEDRDRFSQLLSKLNIYQAPFGIVHSYEKAKEEANRIGYPVLVRPSYVIGGRAMEIVYDDSELEKYMKEAVKVSPEHPILVDKFLEDAIELDVDVLADGEDVFIAGIMEHIEEAGVHSGDSMSIYPPYSLSEQVINTIVDYTTRIGIKLQMIGLFNIQFIVDKDNKVYIIEVNPRSSRTVPFLAKSTGVPIANIATKVMLGDKLDELGYVGLGKKRNRWYVKSPTFSFSKISGMDVVLSPEMKSTGEAIGYDHSLNRALYKSLRASGLRVSNYGTVFVSLPGKLKEEALPLIKRFYDLGFNIEATEGTAKYFKSQGIKTRIKKKISEGSEEILESIKKGYVTYVINNSKSTASLADGKIIRRTAIDNNVPVFTCLDTVKVLLDVLEEITMKISVIDED